MSAYPNPSQPPPAYGPVPEGGTKILLLIVSFIIPIAGIIIGVIYLQRPDPASQKFGRQALIAAVSFFGLFCLCFACYFVFIFAVGSTTFLVPSFAPTPTSLINRLLYV
jgi:hypothetical protein